MRLSLLGVYTRYTGSVCSGTLNSGKANALAKNSGSYTAATEADLCLITPGTIGAETEVPGTTDRAVPDFRWTFDSTYGVISKFFITPINAGVARRGLTLRDEHQNTADSECAAEVM